MPISRYLFLSGIIVRFIRIYQQYRWKTLAFCTAGLLSQLGTSAQRQLALICIRGSQFTLKHLILKYSVDPEWKCKQDGIKQASWAHGESGWRRTWISPAWQLVNTGRFCECSELWGTFGGDPRVVPFELPESWVSRGWMDISHLWTLAGGFVLLY